MLTSFIFSIVITTLINIKCFHCHHHLSYSYLYSINHNPHYPVRNSHFYYHQRNFHPRSIQSSSSPTASNSQLFPYFEKPFQRFCLSKQHKGFYVGRSDEGKNCYYICPDNPRLIPIGQVNYFCCSPNFRLNFYTRICVRTQQLNPHYGIKKYPIRWASKPSNNHQRESNIQQSSSSYCPGSSKPHPYDCKRYYKCLFNLQYVLMKCPFGFGWNPHLKVCDPSYRQCFIDHPTTQINPSKLIWSLKKNSSPSYATRRYDRLHHQDQIPSFKTSSKQRLCYNNQWHQKFFFKHFGTDCRWPTNSNYGTNIKSDKTLPIKQPLDSSKHWDKNQRVETSKNFFRPPKQSENKKFINISSISKANNNKTIQRKFWQRKEPSSTSTIFLPEISTEIIKIDRDLKTSKIPKYFPSSMGSTISSVDLMTPDISETLENSTVKPLSTNNNTNSEYSDAKTTEFPEESTTTTKELFEITTMEETISPTLDLTTEFDNNEASSTTPLVPSEFSSTQTPLMNITMTLAASTTTIPTTTVREPLVFEENSQCYEPTARYKDSEDCQCFYECEFNHLLTRNCCPEGLFFNQLDFEPSVNGTDFEESEFERAYCDLIENVDCKTIIQ